MVGVGQSETNTTTSFPQHDLNPYFCQQKLSENKQWEDRLPTSFSIISLSFTAIKHLPADNYIVITEPRPLSPQKKKKKKKRKERKKSPSLTVLAKDSYSMLELDLKHLRLYCKEQEARRRSD